MTTNYVGTPQEMVQSVESIILGYGDFGRLRALAQEPVQNALDAKFNSPRVKVEYRLHERRDRNGEQYYLLTVTDSGTHGLHGPILSREDLRDRGYELAEGENWAAFEGQGFTRKTDDTARGSRGQGKSALLFHSQPPSARAGRRRMLMLYDTLLAGGEYRLGVRNADPADEIHSPPYMHENAKDVIAGVFSDETGIVIDLRLTPLTSIGTRIIVPYVSDEAVVAIRSGELAKWLQRCWWRAIQIGELEIIVDDGVGRRDTVGVPLWWENEPWKTAQPLGVEYRNHEDIAISDDLRIKRIVLSYDEGLASVDEEGGATSQFEGVQLLRAQQWVTTVGSTDRELSSFVPRERRAGFRGFVEFERELEREMRKRETPQHLSFERRPSPVPQVYRAVESAVEQFATELGWRQERERPGRPNRQPDIAREILRWFSTHGQEPADLWNCSLSFSLPDPKVARVDWGQLLENVRVLVSSPSSYPPNVTVSLEAQNTEESLDVSVRTGEVISFFERDGELKVGNLQVVRNAAKPDQIQLPVEGKWKVTARVRHNGRVVARASRSIYVHQDPPDLDRKPLTMSISVENRTRSVSGRERINYNERVALQINVHNNTPNVVNATLDASIAGANPMLADSSRHSLRGTPAGDSADRQAVWMGEVIFVAPNTLPLPGDDAIVIPVEPGRHRLNADLAVPDDNPNAAATAYTLYIEVDPPNQNGLPFRLEQLPEELPRWRLKEINGETVVQFPENYATHRELIGADTDGGTARRNAFLLEITCEALIQWALEPVWTAGDRTRLDDLCAGEPSGADSDKWERFVEMMELLERAGAEHSEVPYTSFAEDFRSCAAHMMRLYEESH